jgi:glycosyltransferase involved in cell wall biosynthesis
MTSICLNMIVRNEAEVIAETLASVARFVSDYVIVDTGSDDATTDVIRSFFASRRIDGRIIHRPWRDFGHNRTEALHLARELSPSQYVFVIDADDLLVGEPDFGALTHDGYHVRIGASFGFWRVQLFRREAPWRYVGVLHEYPACGAEHATTGYLDGDYCIHDRRFGHRNSDPRKYWKDAAVLERALLDEPDNERYVFYLAQSYYDAGAPELALQWYRRRVEMGRWGEEVFYSRYRAAACLERLGRPWDEARTAYLECFERHPTRAEPLVRVAARERESGAFAAAYEIAQRAASILDPGRGALFVARDVYRYRARDEQAIAAYYLGRYGESFQLDGEILRTAPLSDAERQRIEANRDFSVPHLEEACVRRDAALVERLADGRPVDHEVTLTCTTCKRLPLFIRTVHSFLNTCTDLERIGRWICVDDNSSEDDRREMERLFPFFEFIWKGPDERGHGRSMNILLDAVRTQFWLHLEDDWQFFEPLPYVADALEILAADASLGQVLFNRHYALGVEHRRLAGGIVRHTATGRRYIEHLHLQPGTPEYAEFWQRHPAARSSVHWPHFSLQPSVLRTTVVRSLGRYAEAPGFELELADRYARSGFKAAFFDTICCRHIGRPPRDGSSGFEPNAYELNQTAQWSEVSPLHEA